MTRKSESIEDKFDRLVPTPTISRAGKTIKKRIIPKHLPSDAAIALLEIECSEKLLKGAQN